MQMQMVAQTIHAVSLLALPSRPTTTHTVNRREPEDDPMQCLGGQGAYHAHDAQHQYGDQHGLQRSAIAVVRNPRPKMKKTAKREFPLTVSTNTHHPGDLNSCWRRQAASG